MAKRSTDNGPAKALEMAIANLNRRYGDGIIMKLGEATRLDVAAIPTGSLSLDIALGVGGIPAWTHHRGLWAGEFRQDDALSACDR